MREWQAAWTFGAVVATEKKHRRQTQRDGHDGRVEIALVLVLMQRESRTALVPADETGIGQEALEAGRFRRRCRELPKTSRHRRPGTGRQRIDSVIAVAGRIAHPTGRTAVTHGD